MGLAVGEFVGGSALLGAAGAGIAIALPEAPWAMARYAPRLSQVVRNRAAGNAFRDQVADLLRSAGRDVTTEVYKRTPFGGRFIDIEVGLDGETLGGVETKLGGSPYTAAQQLKDWWLGTQGYIVNVVRGPLQ